MRLPDMLGAVLVEGVPTGTLDRKLGVRTKTVADWLVVTLQGYARAYPSEG